MVAEQLVHADSKPSAMMLHGGRFPEAMPGATAAPCGRIVYFPGKEALDAMPAQELKDWLVANWRAAGGANYLAAATTNAVPMHRGNGSLPVQMSPAVPLHVGDAGLGAEDLEQ